MPTPYVVAWYKEVARCEEVERCVHARLARFRFNPKQEFFTDPLKEAIQVVTEVVMKVRQEEQIAAARAEAKRQRGEQERLRIGAERRLKEEAGMEEEQGSTAAPPGHPRGEATKGIPFRLVDRLSVQCPNCRRLYTVTFRSYEDQPCCPRCKRIHGVYIEW
jgi:hypothetical protein